MPLAQGKRPLCGKLKGPYDRPVVAVLSLRSHSTHATSQYGCLTMRRTCIVPFKVVVIVAVLASVKSIVRVPTELEENMDGS